MKRCFISIEIPEEVKRKILKIQNSLPEFYGKKTEPENLHLTLKFLGEISEKKIAEVKKRLEGVEYSSFETTISSLGYFDNRSSKKYPKNLIVWFYLSNCEGLQKIIDETLSDLFAREKRFMSHLTIARVKKIMDKKYFLENLRKIKIPKMSFNVDKFYLKESFLRKTGVIYETLEEYSLN